MQLMASMAWLKWLDGTTQPGYGVNDYLDDVPRWTGHDEPPPVLFFGNPFTDDRVASWREPPKYPALYVVPDGPVVAEPEIATHWRDYTRVPVVARYLVQGTATEKRARDAAYTMEALHMSTAAFLNDDNNGRAARTTAGKHIRNAEFSALGPWDEDIGEAKAIYVFSMVLYVRNEQPGP